MIAADPGARVLIVYTMNFVEEILTVARSTRLGVTPA
jgi:hypothetical protein